MLKKELLETVKVSLFYAALVAGVAILLDIALGLTGGRFFVTVMMIHQHGMLLFSVLMGISVFAPDSKQRAADYVAALPFSRLKLLGIKVLPRLAAVLVFYLLFVLMYVNLGEAVIMPHEFLSATWFCWLLFGVTLCFSASADNYLRILGLSAAGSFFLLTLLNLSFKLRTILRGGAAIVFEQDAWTFFALDFDEVPAGFIVVTFFLILPFLFSFIKSYVKWGTYSKENFNRGFFKLFFPAVAVGFIVSVLYITFILKPWGPPGYYLTLDHNLIVTNGHSTRMYNTGGDLKLSYDLGNFRYLTEDEGFVYGFHSTPEGHDHVVSIDKGKQTVLYLYKGRSPERKDKNRYWYKMNKAYGVKMFEHFIAVRTNYTDSYMAGGYGRSGYFNTYHFIDTQTGQVRKVKLTDIQLHGYFSPYIRGAGRKGGKVFWLVKPNDWYKFPLIRIWEDGKWEKLDVTLPRFSSLRYFNRMLVTSEKTALVFRRFSEQGVEVVKRIEGPGRPGFIHYPDIRIQSGPIKSVYVSWYRHKRNPRDHYWRLDRLNLETFELTPLTGVPDGDMMRNSRKSADGDVFTFWNNTGNKYAYGRFSQFKKIYRIQDDRFTLVKEFPRVVGPDQRWFSLAGMVIKTGEKEKPVVYAYPDFKPVEFKNIDE